MPIYLFMRQYLFVGTYPKAAGLDLKLLSRTIVLELINGKAWTIFFRHYCSYFHEKEDKILKDSYSHI